MDDRYGNNIEVAALQLQVRPPGPLNLTHASGGCQATCKAVFDRSLPRLYSVEVGAGIGGCFGSRDKQYSRSAGQPDVGVQDVDFTYGREVTLPDTPPTTFGNISLALEVVFLNSAVDATGRSQPRLSLLSYDPGLCNFGIDPDSVWVCACLPQAALAASCLTILVQDWMLVLGELGPCPQPYAVTCQCGAMQPADLSGELHSIVTMAAHSC